MDATGHERLAKQRGRFEQERLRITREIGLLQQRIALLPEDPEMKKLLNEKRILNKEVIPRLLKAMNGKSGEPGKKRQKKHSRKPSELRARTMAALYQGVMLKNIHRLHDLVSPPEPPKDPHRKESNHKQAEHCLQTELAQATDRITEITGIYRQAKHALERAIRHLNDQLHRLHLQELEWSRQNPASANALISFLPTQSPTHPKKKKSRPPPAETANGSFQEEIPACWRFFFTFRADLPGWEIPLQEKQFTRHLGGILSRASYHNVDAFQVYSKLTALVSMTVQQRQRLREVLHVKEFAGWKIREIGKKHRLFVDINEEKRCMRFTVSPRKKSYEDGRFKSH